MMKRTLAVHFVAGLALVFVWVEAAAPQERSTISVILVNRLSTESAQVGDTFTGALGEPLVVGDRVVAQKGARVRGQVCEAVSSGRLKRPALITLRLDSVQSSSRSYPIESGDLTIKAGSHTTRNVVIIGGSVGAGAIIGGATGGGKGAAIGALAGAGAGTLAAYLSGKREIVLPAESVLTFEDASVAITERELARLPRAAERTRAYRQDTDDFEEPRSDADARRRRDRRENEDYETEDYEADDAGKSVKREYGHLGIPPGHLPPPGECRIWIPGRPPGHQPPPQPCGAGLRVPLGGWLLRRDRDAEHVRVSVYDTARAGIVNAIRIYVAATGRFVREERH